MTDKTPISIFCRIKPCIGDSLHETQNYEINIGPEKDTLVISTQQINTAVNSKPDCYNFQFSKVFDQDANQELVYDTVAKPVVLSTLRGYNGTVFAYGQTGSGKTFTISGDADNQGIVPRALQDIFTAIITMDSEKFEVQMSYLEIYNEHSNDLLTPVSDEKKKILLRENCDKVMEWHNLSVLPVETFAQAMELLAIGDNHRIVCDTPMNVFSSRSHTVLTIYLTARAVDSLEVRRSKLNLVDLAGSERVHKTGELGIVLEEAKHINLSLHYLEQVIVALSDNNRTHVPYRNCTMTSALRDSLGGNCMTVMVANIAIDKANFEETVSTCRFAQRVAQVRNEPILNSEKDLSSENSRLREQILQLKSQCSSLQAKVRELDQRSVHKHWRASSQSEQVTNPAESMTPPSSQIEGLNIKQLQTDINELDEAFDQFVATVAAEDDWTKAKEAEQTAAEAVNIKVDNINSVHHEILNWWRHHERSLAKEMLSGRVLNIFGSESLAKLSAPDPDSLSVDSLLARHSDLLKDLQLLKSRLQSSKRNLQRIKRKYMVEYQNWKRGEKSSSEILLEKLGIIDEINTTASTLKQSEIIGLKNNNHEMVDEEKSSSDIHVNKSILNSSDESKLINYKSNNFKSPMRENSMMLDESDWDSSLGDIDSVFSTSTLLSDSREVLNKPVLPRLVRSVPNSLDTAAANCHSPFARTQRRDLSQGDWLPPTTPFYLTGDQDIDDEIIAFYKNKQTTF